MSNRIAIKLKPAAERKVKQQHPWVFDESIVKQSAQGETGDLCIVFDQKKNKFLACGFYDADSPIRIKLMQFGKGASIDEVWFANKIEEAYIKRLTLLETDTNSYRLIFGENDNFPGLIADVYANVLVIKLYSRIWFQHLKTIEALLRNVSLCNTTVLRLSRNLQELDDAFVEGNIVHGKLDHETVIFKEHGVNFSANVIHGHKTGYFLDHRANRKRVGELSTNKTMLDVFSYAGGFSVHALANGASEVTSLDISKQALAVAQENAELNSYKGTHSIIAGDAFKEMEQLITEKVTYDIVVIDPPSFAKRKTEVPIAMKSYRRLVQLGVQLVGSKGMLVMASCSARVQKEEFFSCVESTINESRRRYSIENKTFHDTDHPVGFPEGAYLKCGYYQF